MATSEDPKSKHFYEFGPFRVDPEKELLLRDNESVPIAPKAFQVLLVLVRSKQELVTKDELLKSVWPDTFVEETNLSRNVFLLRKALGESPQDHQYIVTVPGRGYRFAEEVQLIPAEELAVVAASHSTVQVEVKETRRWPWFAVGAVAISAAAYFGLREFGHRPPALTATDTVVLADFENSTGDPVFDGTLRQGLAVQLEQSPFLKVMDDAQLQRNLSLMKLPPGSRITDQIAHDVCVRAADAATIEGAISSLGKSYVITLRAITCKEGATLAREQVQADDKEHVLGALSSAAATLRRKLGESRTSLEQLNRPLEQATTSSLEALQDYTEGIGIISQGRFLAGIPLFERAIEIDPKFALAYYRLGIAYENAGDLKRRREYAERAFGLVDRVSEAERVEITSYYYLATGELDKNVDTLQQWIRNYPDRWSPRNQIATTYIDLGQFDQGLTEALESLRLQPDVEPPYRRLLDIYISEDRFTEAEKVAADARAHGIDGSRIHQRFLELALAEENKPTIAQEIQWYEGRREEYLSFGLQAADLNVHGKRRESHKEYERAAEAAQHQGLQYVADELLEADARADALSGNCQTAHTLGRPALALALCGETARAEKLAAITSKELPNGTIWNAIDLPEIRTAIALQGNEAARGIDLMASATPYEREYPDAIYVRGLAYLKLRKGAEAAAEFSKIVNHKGANWGTTWVHPNWGQYYSLAYLGMARGFALAGDTAKAREAYQALFELWKDADPDLPVLKQARAEFAGLK